MSEPNPFAAEEYRALPAEAVRICEQLSAPPRLRAHLVLVHDTACILIDQVRAAFPGVAFDAELVRFGAAVHDMGKVAHPNELVKSGEEHERDGPEVLISAGVPEARARFAWTHSNWKDREQITLEDLLVALADKSWRGRRIDELEALAAEALSVSSGRPKWECYSKLDEILTSIAKEAERRLSWQARFPV